MDQEQEIRDLVIARLKTRSTDVAVSIGALGSYTANQLIEHVEIGDDVGKKIIEAEMNFLRSLKTGGIYKLLEEDEAVVD